MIKMKRRDLTVLSRRRSISSGVLGAVCWLACLAPAHADERTYASFYYTVDTSRVSGDLAECPTEEMVKRAVSERLGYVPWREKALLNIETTIQVLPDIIRAHVVMSDALGNATGERHITSKESCKEVAKAVELALSIAIDPLSLTHPPNDEPPPPPPEPPVQREVVVETVCKEENNESPFRLSTQLGGLGTWRSSPEFTGGGRAVLEMHWKLASLGLAARYDAPVSRSLRPGSLRAFQVLGELFGCVTYRYLLACAVLAGGGLRVDVSGLSEPNDTTLPSLSLGARLGVTVPLGPVFFLRFFGDFNTALLRSRLRETGSDILFWRTPPYSAGFGISVGITFFDRNSRENTIKE